MAKLAHQLCEHHPLEPIQALGFDNSWFKSLGTANNTAFGTKAY
jgi:hypothetical protein